MESCKSIIEATATRWRWIRNCWRLRLPVREALLANTADATDMVMTKAELEFWRNKATETDKALKESKDANKALVHFIHVRNTPDVDLKAVKKAMTTVALVFLPLLAMSQPLEPYRHNFFTTNPAPVVDVLPGTNVSVQLSLTGTSQRHYTVNTDTNLIPIYAGGSTNGSKTNQVLTQVGWSGYPQVTNLSLWTNDIGTAIVPSLWLTNPTPAALGAQQNSPALMLGGQGWRSGNSTTKPVQMGLYTLPIQGSSAEPKGRLYVAQSINSVAPANTFNDAIYFDSDGNVNCYTFRAAAYANVPTFYMAGYVTVRGILNAGLSTMKITDIATENEPAALLFGLGNNNFVSLKVETTNSPTLSVRTGANANYASLTASNITAKGSVTATNNYIHQFYQTNGFTYCNSTNEVYMVNAATNPIFVLPDASVVKGKSFLFTTTNNGTFFTVTNWTGTQTIADGSSLSYTNQDNGKKVVSFISDGAHWWLASKGRVTLPSASWSCSTNTTFPNVTNMVTLDTQEANNGVGITLDNSAWTTVGVGSRIWVTNSGMYMLTFSAMWSKTGGGSANGDIWIRQDGTIIPRTMTLQTIQNSTSTNVMTVNFILPVTKTTYFDLVGASPDGTAQLQAMPAITSPFQRPAAPSIIVTINKCSD